MRALLVVALVACGGKTTATSGECTKAAAHLQSLDPDGDSAAITKLYADRCSIDKWSTSATACMESLKTIDDQRCERELTSEQQQAVMTALQSYMLARRPVPPSRERCRQLLEHLMDLEFQKAGAKVDLDAKKASIVDAKGDEFIANCVGKTLKARVDCAIAATDLDAVAKCDR